MPWIEATIILFGGLCLAMALAFGLVLTSAASAAEPVDVELAPPAPGLLDEGSPMLAVER